MKKPFEMAVTDETEVIVVDLELAAVSPADVLAGFTDAALVRAWWAGATLTFEPVVGGPYVAEFAAIEKTMRGTVTAYVPGESLAFTWAWDHEPAAKEFAVSISAEASGEGTSVRLRHGAYAEGDGEAKQGHREGWEHFLPKLADVLVAAR